MVSFHRYCWPWLLVGFLRPAFAQFLTTLAQDSCLQQCFIGACQNIDTSCVCPLITGGGAAARDARTCGTAACGQVDDFNQLTTECIEAQLGMLPMSAVGNMGANTSPTAVTIEKVDTTTAIKETGASTQSPETLTSTSTVQAAATPPLLLTLTPSSSLSSTSPASQSPSVSVPSTTTIQPTNTPVSTGSPPSTSCPPTTGACDNAAQSLPDTVKDNAATAPKNTPSGVIAAAVVVPLVAIAAAVAGFYYWRRQRRKRRRSIKSFLGGSDLDVADLGPPGSFSRSAPAKSMVQQPDSEMLAKMYPTVYKEGASPIRADDPFRNKQLPTVPALLTRPPQMPVASRYSVLSKISEVATIESPPNTIKGVQQPSQVAKGLGPTNYQTDESSIYSAGWEESTIASLSRNNSQNTGGRPSTDRV